MPDQRASLRVRLAPVIAVIVLLLVGAVAQHGATSPRESGDGAAKTTRPHAQPGVHLARNAGSTDLSAYRDLGSWIDIYDSRPWAHPTLAVRKLHRRGVRTIFLQTSNYGAKDAIFRPKQTTRFLRASHRRGMEVVAWSVPSFAHPQVDYHRARAAILFRRRGHRFDSFGLDIEATVVGNIWRRNKRLLELSKGLRALVGPDYTLGAITPDPVNSLYWPDFPYRRVDRLYDVFVPMGYFSFRADGYKDVKRYAARSIRVIRRESQDPRVPIHLIGGIGGETDRPEVKGFVRAVKGHKVLGASYYDFAVTSEREWRELETIVGEHAKPNAEPEPAPTAEPPPAPEVRPTPLTAGAAVPRKVDAPKSKPKAEVGNANATDGKRRGALKNDERHAKKRGRSS